MPSAAKPASLGMPGCHFALRWDPDQWSPDHHHHHHITGFCSQRIIPRLV